MTKEKIIVALDVSTTNEAREIIAELRDAVGAFKIGLQLFTAGGASFVREAVSAGIRIFLDVKFHDIPNTVAKASVEVARLGVWMFNIHALGGGEMMRRTSEEVREICEREKIFKPKILGVTVLTSANAETLREAGIESDIDGQVLKLSRLAAECGLDGVVASPHETPLICEAVDKNDFLIVTPGVRPGFATSDDQKRVMTPSQAISSGADYLVIGRPILRAENRIEAVEKILQEIQEKGQ